MRDTKINKSSDDKKLERNTDKEEYKNIDTYELKQDKDIVKESQPAYMQKRYTLEDYYALPEERRAELINGVFYDMASPSVMHQMIVRRLVVQISNYIDRKRGKCLLLHSPMDVQLDCDIYTMVQPDIMVVCDRNKNADRCIVGAPDLIIEVLSPSTKSKDTGIKLYKYREAGVREYWIVDSKEERVVVHDFENGKESKVYTAEEEVPVGIYDGKLKIDFKSIFENSWT